VSVDPVLGKNSVCVSVDPVLGKNGVYVSVDPVLGKRGVSVNPVLDPQSGALRESRKARIFLDPVRARKGCMWIRN
jgi:hypothetical protein